MVTHHLHAVYLPGFDQFVMQIVIGGFVTLLGVMLSNISNREIEQQSKIKEKMPFITIVREKLI